MKTKKKNSLSRYPIHVNQNCWYYTEENKLSVVQENVNGETVVIEIPYRKLAKAVKSYLNKRKKK